MTISADQCRGARAILRLPIRDLAARAGLAVSTLARFEAGDEGIKPITIDKIEEALVAAGAAFHEELWVSRDASDQGAEE